jgi:hypothetical protein
MSRLQPWKSGAAALMALTITTGAVAPMIVSAPPAVAQFPNQPTTIRIPAGVTIPVTYEKNKILLTQTETLSLKLKVASDIVDNSGRVLIPANTEIAGKLQPAKRNSLKGSQFIASELIFPNGQRQSINANSQVITTTQKITKGADTGTIIQDAAIGGAAAAVISGITGNKKIRTWKVLGGAGLGTLASIYLRKKEVEVISINPDPDLNLTLRSSLPIRYQP